MALPILDIPWGRSHTVSSSGDRLTPLRSVLRVCRAVTCVAITLLLKTERYSVVGWGDILCLFIHQRTLTRSHILAAVNVGCTYLFKALLSLLLGLHLEQNCGNPQVSVLGAWPKGFQVNRILVGFVFVVKVSTDPRHSRPGPAVGMSRPRPQHTRPATCPPPLVGGGAVARCAVPPGVLGH